MASGGTARLLALPVGALCTALAAYVSIRYVGPDNYGYVTLISTLFLLLVPIADFGLGAVVINAIADASASENGLTADEMQTIWRVIVRVGTISLVLVTGVFIVAILDGWSRLLNLPTDLAGANYATAAALSVFFLAGVFGVGSRILTGLGRVGELTMLSMIAPVVTTLATTALVAIRAPIVYLSVPPAIGILVFNVALAWRALRYLGVSVKELRAARPTSAPSPLAHSAISFLVMNSGVAIALQSHRVILSHYSTAVELAVYSLMAQMYLPILSLTYTGTLALWSAYKRSGEDARLLWISSLRTMAILGTLLGLIFGFASPFVARLISSGDIHPSALLAGSFACLLVVISIHQASGYLLTDRSGLRFQAYCVAAFAALAVSMSIALARPLGAAGPVLASAVAVFITLLLPGIVRARQVLKAK